jgi:hypothetical protein
MAKETAKLKIAYHIKKENRNGEEKSFFNRIGRAFVNKDGSINLFLDYIPTQFNDETVINIRDYEPKEKKEGDGFSE